MTDPRWVARIRANIRGYPLLDRETWYPVLSSDDLGSIVDLWGKQVFIFAIDAEYKLNETAGADLVGSFIPVPSAPGVRTRWRSTLPRPPKPNV